jgi:beta-glucanase (GH16 family)
MTLLRSLALAAVPLVLAVFGCSNDDDTTPASTLASRESAPTAPDPARTTGACTGPDCTETNATPAPSASTPAPDAKKEGTLGNPNGCTLKFHDEFDTFDPNVWNDHIWYETSNATKNYAASGGKLKIWPQRDSSGKFFNRTIDTDGRYYQTYGYFEASAKLTKGKGTWPAFWVFNHIDNRRPEIDIMEAYPGGEFEWGTNGPGGVRLPTAFAATIWPFGADAPNGGSKRLVTPDLSAAFHRYGLGLLWKNDKQTFYFDGQPFYEVKISMNDPMYLMLDLWFGSASGTPDDSTPQGIANSYEVDWVRTWDCPGTNIPTP